MILLKFKHWQIFFISWVIPVIVVLSLINNWRFVLAAFPFLLIYMVIFYFGWIWAICIKLKAMLPEGIKLNYKKFKTLFLVVVIYCLVLAFYISSKLFGFMPDLGNKISLLIVILFIPFHLISMVIIVWSSLFAARTIKSIEESRDVSLSDYVFDAILILFPIIGYWIIQPRLNDLVKNISQQSFKEVE